MTLAAAREEALDNARAVAGGRDPRSRTRRVPTFAQACETVIAIHAGSWKGARNEREWRATLREYAMPSLAARRVDAIATADVMAVLVPNVGVKPVIRSRTGHSGRVSRTGGRVAALAARHVIRQAVHRDLLQARGTSLSVCAETTHDGYVRARERAFDRLVWTEFSRLVAFNLEGAALGIGPLSRLAPCLAWSDPCPQSVHRATRTAGASDHVRGCRRLKSSAISRMVTKRTPGFELMYSNSRSCIASTCGRPDTSGWMVIGKTA